MNIRYELTSNEIRIRHLAQKILLAKLYRNYDTDCKNCASHIFKQVISKQEILLQLSTAIIAGEIIGWAFVMKAPHWMITSSFIAEVFVNKRFRRHGVGTKLLKIARDLRVTVWEDEAPKFFACQSNLSNEYKTHIRVS
jgi:GNAT superfamily N-acetyltransferase